MRVKVKAILLWFTAGIGGFVLGFLLGRATAKRVYMLPERREYADDLRNNFRLILLRTAIFGITCGMVIFFAWYFTRQPTQNQFRLSENRVSEGKRQQTPLDPYSPDNLFMYPTDPPQIINPDNGKLEYLNFDNSPSSSFFIDKMKKAEKIAPVKE